MSSQGESLNDRGARLRGEATQGAWLRCDARDQLRGVGPAALRGLAKLMVQRVSMIYEPSDVRTAIRLRLWTRVTNIQTVNEFISLAIPLFLRF